MHFRINMTHQEFTRMCTNTKEPATIEIMDGLPEGCELRNLEYDYGVYPPIIRATFFYDDKEGDYTSNLWLLRPTIAEIIEEK